MVADDTFSITSQDAELLLSSTYVATDESLLPKKRWVQFAHTNNNTA